MDKKLTLKLSQVNIKQAKNFALKSKTSVSKLVENFFSYLGKSEKQVDTSSLVREISGSISIPENLNGKKEYRKYLSNRYEK